MTPIKRQHRWQAKRISAGKCGQCGKPRNLYALLCDECAEKVRIANRHRSGSKPWKNGGRGRPPRKVPGLIRSPTELLFGPYRAPGLSRGERTFCLARNCDVIVTSWTDARISWPRCRKLGCSAGSGILVDEELARAIRNESALALHRWWGASKTTIWWWRRRLGIGREEPEGSRRLAILVRENAVSKLRGKKLSAKQRVERRKRALALNLVQHLRSERNPRIWKREELALLGKLPDAELAQRIGRTANGVRVKRTRVGIRSALDRRSRKAVSIKAILEDSHG